MKLRILNAAIMTALFTSTTQVHAAGFQLAEYSSTGLGRAFAGEATIADNASAQAKNPALLIELKGRQVSAGAIYVMPNVDVPGDVSILSPLLGSAPLMMPASATDVADNAVVPNFYYSNQLNEHWTWGMAVNSNYGLATEVDATHAAALFGQHTSVKTVEFNPNIAFKVDDKLSLGAGVRVVYGDGELNASMPGWIEGLKANPNIPESIAQRLPAAGTSLKSLEGDDVAFGWQLGANYKLSANHRFGLAYHSGVELELKGTASGALYRNAQGKNIKFDGQLPLELPAFAEFSTHHQLSNNFAIHTSINWTQWSEFKELRAQFPGIEKPIDPSTDLPIANQVLKVENFEDNWRYAIGATYQVNPSLAMRAGMALDQTAVSDEYRTTTIPDSDRLWFSVGAGYQVSKNLNVDFGITYIKSRGEAPIIEKQAIKAPPGLPFENIAEIDFEGEAQGDVWLVGSQISYRF
ncbi:aromatic hydrocarbon degradation protein [Parashewanella spongiae]|uniref:Aromatic hydrocarbon degradation protein n=1 Tax=Parashewanella spongiae TaxID=342950 RepID=A0A3A6U017_9GAMM|nr:outer membrane protein transport protein [Parashewanella spongiae]MCL1077022.1 outer membrane protein transport protein [Parashewanella spongiae]RJY18764.1 aromatic hydrocarbon degradation protein [Parashewanella spongiae]